jgi:putative ABC transport system permease protein
MLKVTLSGLRAHTARFVLTVLVVVLSIGFTAGTLVLTDSLAQAGVDRAAASAAGVDLAVLSPAGSDEYLDDVLVSAITEIDEVAAIAARRDVEAQFVDADGRIDPSSVAWLIAVPADAALAALQLTEGRAPARDDEAVLDSRWADRLGIEPGDTFSLAVMGDVGSPTTMGDAGAVPFTIVGIAERLGRPGDHPEVSAPFTALEQFTDQPGAARIDIRLDDADGRAVRAALEEVAGGRQVLSGDELTTKLVDESTSVGVLRIPLLMLGAVALIVAAFVIANTFRILVAQRTHELALLRTVGATRRQVRAAVLVESAAVGVVGSAAGIVMGSMAAFAVGPLLDNGSRGLPVVVSTSTVVWSMLVGVAMTVGSAVLPARAATRVAPLAAVRALPDGADSSAMGRARVLGGIGLIVTGTCLLMAGALVASSVGLVAVVFGGAICFLGILVLGPRIVPPGLRLLGGVAARLARSSWTTTDLATANAVRNPRRVAATSAALLIGVTMMTGFVTMADSTRTSAGVVLDHQIPADFVVQAIGEDGVSEPAVETIDALAETGPVVELYRSSTSVDGLGPVDVHGLDLAAYDLIASVYGVGSAGAGGVAIDPITARENGLNLGDSLTIADRTVRIGFVADGVSVPFEGLVVAPDLFRQLFPAVDRPEQLAIDAADGVDGSSARSAIIDATADLPEISVLSFVDSRDDLNDQMDQVVNTVLAILGLSVVIAIIGITNTLSLSVHERIREIGLLRTLGLTRRQIQTMLGIEAVLMSVVTAIIGAFVGVAFAWAAVLSLSDLVLAIPWGQVALSTVAAALLGLLASVVPGRRAARISPVAALATE